MKIVNDFEQGTPEWHDFRLGKISGTTIKAINGTADSYWRAVAEIVSERATGREKTIRSTEEMIRGNAEEKFAIKRIEEDLGVKVENVGICVSDENPLWILSPDGFVVHDSSHCEYVEAVEVKSFDSKKHVFNMMQNLLPDIAAEISKSSRTILGVPKENLDQVIHYFVVVETLETLRFTYWDPRIIQSDRQIEYQMIYRNDPTVQNLIIKHKDLLVRFEEDVKMVENELFKSDF